MVETPPGAVWILVANRAQESVARLIVAHAALNGETTALVLTERPKNVFIQIYPLVSMTKDALIACPNTGRKEAVEITSVEASAEVAPVICHCGETHAWARRAAS